MNKKKRIAIALTVLFSALLISVIAYKVYPSIAIKPALCEKYGWEKSDIKILKHKNAHYEHDFGFFGLDMQYPPIWRINEKWVCEYNGREFNVEYTDNQFADDYQLEDIFKWCTEWLQENVDPEIVGVEIFSDIIYHSSEYKDNYMYTLSWDTNKVFTKNDAFELLKVQREYESTNGLGVFYKVDCVENYGWPREKESNWFVGNKDYEKYCNKKEILLSKSTLTKDSKIILVFKPVFSREYGALSGTGFNIEYKLKANEEYAFKY